MESSQGFSLLILVVASVINTFLFLVGGSGALRDVEIVVPRYVRRGEDVRFNCNYNPERDQIYAVNWYRAGERKKASEFYRYVPKEAPPQKAFQLPGFIVDVRRSSDHDVYLRNVSLEISGLYKCSVTAEQTFQTLSSTSEMTVVVIGEGPPSIHLDRTQYHSGDPVTVECQSPYSFPPANITWYYNETEVDSSATVKTEYMKSNIDPMTQSTLSRYSFELPIPEKVEGTVSIQCRVKLFNLYDQNSTVQTIAPIPRRLTGTDTFLRQGASTSSSQSTTPASKPVAVLIQVFNFILLLCLTSYLTTPTIQSSSKSPSSLRNPTAAASIVQYRNREISTRSLTAYLPIDSKLYCPGIFATKFNLFSRYYNFYYLSQNTPTSTTVDDAHSVLYYENSW